MKNTTKNKRHVICGGCWVRDGRLGPLPPRIEKEKRRCCFCGGKPTASFYAIRASEGTISFTYLASIGLLTPLTKKAVQWVARKLNVEDWQWYAGGFAVELRYAGGIVRLMRDGGLKVDVIN